MILDSVLKNDVPHVYADEEANIAAAQFANLVFVMWQSWRRGLEERGIEDYQQEIDDAFIHMLKIHIWG